MKTSSFFYSEGEWNFVDFDNSQLHSPEIVLVFADRILLENNTISNQLKKKLPDTRLIFCSTAGEINNQHVFENSAVCTALSFENTKTDFSIGNISKHKNSFDLGKNTASALKQKDLKYILVISDGNLINGDELVEGIQSAIDPSVKISGGLAGDGARFKKTLVGLDDNIQEGNLVLMGLYGDKIKVGSGFEGGWDVFGPEKIITKSAGNVLYEVNNQAALDVYKKYLGKYADELPSSALLFPLSLKSKDDDTYIVRTILSIDEKQKSMTFAGNMPEGSGVRLMKSNFDNLVNAASEAGNEANAKMENIPVELALIVSCVGRKLVLSGRIEEEVEAAIEKLTPGATVAGFFSYGEIVPHHHLKCSHLHNQTITITTFSELP